jgi:plastocyanin
MKRVAQFTVSLGLIVLFASAYLAACQAATPAPINSGQTPGISLNITSGICPSLTVTAGDLVTWTNQDQQVHLIHIEPTEGKKVKVFDSGDLQPGDSVSFVFSQVGTYLYVCSSDRESTGTITVEP